MTEAGQDEPGPLAGAPSVGAPTARLPLARTYLAVALNLIAANVALLAPRSLMGSAEDPGAPAHQAGTSSGTSNAALDLLLTRRSTPAALLREPGPSSAQLDLMIAAATRVPDHGSLRPWRFLLYRGAVREQVGSALAALAEELAGPLSTGRVAKERNRFSRAPLVVGVVASPRPSAKVPEAEMLLSAGAAALALSLAGNAMGFGTCWVTNWYSNTPAGRDLLGLAPHELVAGFIHIGTPSSQPPLRVRPSHDDLVADYTGPWSRSAGASRGPRPAAGAEPAPGP